MTNKICLGRYLSLPRLSSFTHLVTGRSNQLIDIQIRFYMEEVNVLANIMLVAE